MEKTSERGAFSFYVREYLGYAGSGIKRFFKTDRQLWISFLTPCLTLLISYFIFQVFPFGDNSVLSLDLNGQYVYYYDYMYDVFAGKESLFYSWSRNLSGEFMGIIGYYLASPFNFLVWIWPRECITEGLLTMMVTKVGAIGFCMAIYLSRCKNMDRLTTVIFSTCYALSAYTLEQTMNPMWLDGVMILPIVIFGIEKLIDEGKFIMLTISLVYAFVTCFYIGYMIGIFSAIYFFYYSVATHKKKFYRLFIPRGLMFTGVAIVSVMISAFMLLPVYHSLSYGKFDFSDNVTQAKELSTNFDFIEILNKMFPGTYDTCRMSGLPFVYCGTVVLILLPCYFFLKKIRGRDRIATAVLISILVVSMYIREADMVWHGGQRPNWLPYRYSFMLSFIMTACAARAFNERKEISKKAITISSLAWFGVLLGIDKIGHYVEDIKRDTMDGLAVVLPAMLVLLIVSAAVVQLKDKVSTKKPAVVLLCLILLAECFYNTISQLNRQDADIVYSTRPSYVDVIQPTRQKVEEIKENDPGFYRIEKTYFRTVNDPLATNMYGLSHSSSMLNAKPINLLKDLGFSARSHYTRYTGATEITKSLFGVKYELSNSDDTQKVKSVDDIIVNKNEYALPMAYLVDKAYSSLKFTENDPFENQNKLLKAMLGNTFSDAKYFRRIQNSEETPVNLEKVNVTQGKTTDGHHSFKIVTEGKNAEIVYTLNMPAKSSLYMYLPSKYERTVNVWLNRKTFLGKYFENDNNSIMKIGDFEEGEQVIIGLTLTKSDLYFREAQFVYVDEDVINKDLQALKDMNTQTVCERPTPTEMKVTVNAEKDMYLFTSIPEEKGWTVYIDGKKADLEPQKGTDDPGLKKINYYVALDSLLTVPVSAGQHTIEFRFVTAGYPVAIYCSIAGLLLFVVSILLYLRFFRGRNAKKLDMDFVITPGAENEDSDAYDDESDGALPDDEVKSDDGGPDNENDSEDVTPADTGDGEEDQKKN